MKQILLATALILAPVGVFTAVQMTFVQRAQATAALGDLSPMIAIVTDVQKIAATGDFAGASARITDWETAWDTATPGMRPLNPAAWATIDLASDTALKAVRAPRPAADTVNPALAALSAALTNPAGK